MFLRIIFSFFSDLCGLGAVARVFPNFGCGSAALSSLRLDHSSSYDRGRDESRPYMTLGLFVVRYPRLAFPRRFSYKPAHDDRQTLHRP